jgi:peptide/nickel transport system substrate-binding protein
MTPMPKRLAVLAMAVLATAGLAACGKSSSSSSSSSASAGKPVSGGTLRIVAASGWAHLDTVAAYDTSSYMLERAFARQLLSYPYAAPTALGSASWNKAITPAADVATVVPTQANGGISSNGLTYTFHIKPGVMWNSSPPRQVTSADFIREFRAFYNPVQPVGAPFYYNATIAGLQTYDNQETAYFAVKSHKPTAINISNFQNTHTISGISAPNSSTLKIKLIHPASDFLYMLAMPFASARPVEYDKYVPASAQFNQHVMSDGPYQITSVIPGKSLTMTRNPAWQQSTSTIRHQYVSKITLTIGVSSAQTQLADEKANTYDLVEDTPFDPSAIPQLQASKDPKFHIWPDTNNLPYLVFNLRSPDANGAMNNLKVRQAFEYGISKVAVSKAYGGPAVAKIIGGVIPPGNVGYVNSAMYPDNNGSGNVSQCKSLLKQAGYPNGVTLTGLYINDSVNSQVFQAIQASLKNCGITLSSKPEPGSSYFTDLGNAPVNNKPGQWDVATSAGWFPDWFGNNGRTIIPPFFQTNCVINTINYGCYSSKQMDSFIKQAEAAPTTSAAGALWHQADMLAMKDAVMVPLLAQQYPYYSSARVHNAGSTAVAFQPNIGNADITNVWLSPNTP